MATIEMTVPRIGMGQPATSEMPEDPYRPDLPTGINYSVVGGDETTMIVRIDEADFAVVEEYLNG